MSGPFNEVDSIPENHSSRCQVFSTKDKLYSFEQYSKQSGHKLQSHDLLLEDSFLGSEVFEKVPTARNNTPSAIEAEGLPTPNSPPVCDCAEEPLLCEDCLFKIYLDDYNLNHADLDDKVIKDKSCITTAKKEFHLFPDLPYELKLDILERAWPTRLVRSCTVDPGIFSCLGCIPMLNVPTSRPASLSLVSHLIQSCIQRSTAKTVTVWTRMPANGQLLRLLRHRRAFWYNRETDLFWLHHRSLKRVISLAGPFRGDDPLTAALDPRKAIMVDANMLDCYLDPREGAAMLNLVYWNYLRPRMHVYIRVWYMFLTLTAQGRKIAYERKLFAGYEAESRLVDVNDKKTLVRYLELLEYSSHRRRHERTESVIVIIIIFMVAVMNNVWRFRRAQNTLAWSVATRLPNFRVELTDAQLFQVHIADFALECHGAGPRQGGRILQRDGSLKHGHPFVKEFQIRLPLYTPVCVFEVGDVLIERFSSLRISNARILEGDDVREIQEQE